MIGQGNKAVSAEAKFHALSDMSSIRTQYEKPEVIRRHYISTVTMGSSRLTSLHIILPIIITVTISPGVNPNKGVALQGPPRREEVTLQSFVLHRRSPPGSSLPALHPKVANCHNGRTTLCSFTWLAKRPCQGPHSSKTPRRSVHKEPANRSSVAQSVTKTLRHESRVKTS
ncbi:hypothetical protein ASPVEDRAFT_793555 [Aspergillus versicolor CBS 583.65]|uniref:Uncharacterized protein n=1 Tax=Aspergillus versicolor CBS 583.65 TaxID=1036611 RepID=A0A1L9PSL4_ASPVE|nr:uncharacterized protein ASPVEDRAFT_793555 [Aspergillus versicolor CBS 583.65]OJJ04530.1 hypothetical protein ASPVEDRAFT_793555 [Aspergillus versicolor CBS 583.65]